MDTCIPLQKGFTYRKQVYLPFSFSFNDGLDKVQCLHTLYLHTCSFCDGDVDILPDCAQSSFHLACGTEYHTNVGSRFLCMSRCNYIRCCSDLHKRDTKPVK